MRFIKLLLLMLFLAAGSAFAYDYNIDWKASKLEDAAYQVAHKLRHETGFSHVSAHARRFAREVSHFRRVVRSGAHARTVRKEFRYIRGKFYRLMSAFRHSHDVHHSYNVRWSIKKLKFNYRRLREEIFRNDNKYNPFHWNYPNG